MSWVTNRRSHRAVARRCGSGLQGRPGSARRPRRRVRPSRRTWAGRRRRGRSQRVAACRRRAARGRTGGRRPGPTASRASSTRRSRSALGMPCVFQRQFHVFAVPASTGRGSGRIPGTPRPSSSVARPRVCRRGGLRLGGGQKAGDAFEQGGFAGAGRARPGRRILPRRRSKVRFRDGFDLAAVASCRPFQASDGQHGASPRWWTVSLTGIFDLFLAVVPAPGRGAQSSCEDE